MNFTVEQRSNARGRNWSVYVCLTLSLVAAVSLTLRQARMYNLIYGRRDHPTTPNQLTTQLLFNYNNTTK
jgi:hypothetical protein